MPEYSDIYIITEKRDKAIVESFLQHFLPEREESAEEYEIPQYSENPKILPYRHSGLDALVPHISAGESSYRYMLFPSWLPGLSSRIPHRVEDWLTPHLRGRDISVKTASVTPLSFRA